MEDGSLSNINFGGKIKKSRHTFTIENIEKNNTEVQILSKKEIFHKNKKVTWKKD